MIRTISAALVAAATLTAVPAAAQDAPTARVAYADLRLAHSADMKFLQARVSAAIRVVCGMRDTRDLAEMSRIEACRSKAKASGGN